MRKWTKGYQFFTDGSKTESCVRSGVTIFQDGVPMERSYDLPSYATVFQTELAAITKALELCSSLYESSSLYTDSMCILMGLSNLSCQNSLVGDIHWLREGLEVKWY